MSLPVTLLIPIHRTNGNRQWLAETIASFPPGTTYFVCENDGDVGGALNDGLAAAETEFVMPFGADDIAQPGMLETLVELAWDCDVVYPSMTLVNETGEKVVGIYQAQPFCGNRLQTWNFVTGGFLGRTAMLRKVGGWRDLETLEDWDLHVRMFRAGARFKPAPQTHFLYRQVPGSRNRSSTISKAEWQQRIVGTPPELAATFYYQATPATTYWRCQVPSRHLPGQCQPHAEYAEFEDGAVDFGDHQGTAVFQFAADKLRARIAGVSMPEYGIRTLVEVDDNYLDETDTITRQRANWGLRIGQSAHTVKGHRWIVANVDGVICSTPRLAEIYSDVNPNVYVCRNSIDLDDWPAHPKPDDGVFRIGWFASFSHDRDGRLIRSALSWASRQPDVEILTMGYNPPWDFARKHIPWSDDMGVYRKNLHLLDVGVCPVLQTGWSECRSDVKALEYATAGALPVMSIVPPYKGWRDKPGLFAHSAKAWAEQIKWCVTHRDEARELAAQAREYVLSERLIQHEIGKWKEAVAGA